MDKTVKNCNGEAIRIDSGVIKLKIVAKEMTERMANKLVVNLIFLDKHSLLKMKK
tara:strand:+ start:157 stop:321 length:165 start_codon:yes stop_codon:yes gene_type:complete